MRAVRVASHIAPSTTGNPMMTDSEIVRPPPRTSFSALKLSGPPRPRTKYATTASCPANIATKINRPHNVVPQNFHARDASGGGNCDAAALGELEMSSDTWRIAQNFQVFAAARVTDQH